MDDAIVRSNLKAEMANLSIDPDKTYVNRNVFAFEDHLPKNISTLASTQTQIQPQNFSPQGASLTGGKVIKFVVPKSHMYTNLSMSFIESIIAPSVTNYCIPDDRYSSRVSGSHASTASPATGFGSNVGDLLFSSIRIRLNNVDISDDNGQYQYIAAHIRKLLRYNRAWFDTPYTRREAVLCSQYYGANLSSTAGATGLKSAQATVAYRTKCAPSEVFGINLHSGITGEFDNSGDGYGIGEDAVYSAIDEVALTKNLGCNFITDRNLYQGGTWVTSANVPKPNAVTNLTQGSLPKYQAVVSPLNTSIGESALCIPPGIEIEIECTINQTQLIVNTMPSTAGTNIPYINAAVTPAITAQSMYLYLQQFMPSQSCYNLFKEAIMSQSAIIPLVRTRVNAISLAAGSSATYNINGMFAGPRPQAIFIAFPRASAISGSYYQSPYSWGYKSAVYYPSGSNPANQNTQPQVVSMQGFYNDVPVPYQQYLGSTASGWGLTNFTNNKPNAPPAGYSDMSGCPVTGIYNRLYAEFCKLCVDCKNPSISFEAFCEQYTLYPFNLMEGDTKIGEADDSIGTLGQFRVNITFAAPLVQDTTLLAVAFGISNVILTKHDGSDRLGVQFVGF